MKAADVKDVASSITTIANEKLKAEKEAAAGKKKGIILNVLLTITSSLVYSFMNVLFWIRFSWPLALLDQVERRNNLL